MISMEMGTWESVDAVKEIFSEYLAVHVGEETLETKICGEFITYAAEQRRIHDAAKGEKTDEAGTDDHAGGEEGSEADDQDPEALPSDNPQD